MAKLVVKIYSDIFVAHKILHMARLKKADELRAWLKGATIFTYTARYKSTKGEYFTSGVIFEATTEAEAILLTEARFPTAEGITVHRSENILFPKSVASEQPIPF